MNAKARGRQFDGLLPERHENRWWRRSDMNWRAQTMTRWAHIEAPLSSFGFSWPIARVF